MAERNFMGLLQERWSEGRFVCVGLDSELGKIPESCRKGYDTMDAIAVFNERTIEQTHDLACAYKPNLAFYLAHGLEGLEALELTVEFINRTAPDVPVILDAKFGDIGNTNNGYAEMAFDWLKADAVTVNPLLGIGALKPFLDRKDKGIFILCRTSNAEASEFQDLPIDPVYIPTRTSFPRKYEGECRVPVYKFVAHRVASEWNKGGNCALVVGATYPDQLREVRELVGDLPILIPGLGAQGGEVEATVKAGRNSRRQGIIPNASRSIIFASSGPDFAEAARRATQELHDEITKHLAA